MWASGRRFKGNMTAAEGGKGGRGMRKRAERRMLMVRRIDA
jgi:hypothetical protein